MRLSRKRKSLTVLECNKIKHQKIILEKTEAKGLLRLSRQKFPQTEDDIAAAETLLNLSAEPFHKSIDDLQSDEKEKKLLEDLMNETAFSFENTEADEPRVRECSTQVSIKCC